MVSWHFKIQSKKCIQKEKEITTEMSVLTEVKDLESVELFLLKLPLKKIIQIEILKEFMILKK